MGLEVRTVLDPFLTYICINIGVNICSDEQLRPWLGCSPYFELEDTSGNIYKINITTATQTIKETVAGYEVHIEFKSVADKDYANIEKVRVKLNKPSPIETLVEYMLSRPVTISAGQEIMAVINQLITTEHNLQKLAKAIVEYYKMYKMYIKWKEIERLRKILGQAGLVPYFGVNIREEELTSLVKIEYKMKYSVRAKETEITAGTITIKTGILVYKQS